MSSSNKTTIQPEAPLFEEQKELWSHEEIYITYQVDSNFCPNDETPVVHKSLRRTSRREKLKKQKDVDFDAFLNKRVIFRIDEAII